MDTRDVGVIVGVKDRQHAALSVGVREARRRGVGVTVVHAYGVQLEPEATYAARDVFAAAQARAEEVLAQALHHIRPLTDGVAVRSLVARADATSVLTGRSEGAALVVLGADGHRLRDRLMGATVARDVSARASCPVLVVPQHEEPWRDGAPVVVALDVTDPDHGPLRYALEEASRSEAPLVVVQADHHTASPRPDEDVLKELVDRWHREFPTVDVQLRSGATSQLRRCAEETATASMVVVGRPRHRSLLDLRTPTATFVLTHAEGPVVVVPQTYGWSS